MSDYFEMAKALDNKKDYYCYAEAVVGKQWNACAEHQCKHCMDYQKMLTPAHFPVPALSFRMVYRETISIRVLQISYDDGSYTNWWGYKR